MNKWRKLLRRKNTTKMASYNTSENSPFENQKIEISFVMSNKGNPLIICNNYLFGFIKQRSRKNIRSVLNELAAFIYIHLLTTNWYVQMVFIIILQSQIELKLNFYKVKWKNVYNIWWRGSSKLNFRKELYQLLQNIGNVFVTLPIYINDFYMKGRICE